MMRFNPSVSHIPGKQLVIADALSRNPVSHDDKDSKSADEVEFSIDSLHALWPASQHRLQQIRELTSHDPDLSLVKEYILNGWPRQNSQLPPSLKCFVDVKSLLSIAEGIITYGDRILIPPTLRKEMLERLHESHQGISKTLQMAASCLWWPGIQKTSRT